VTGGSLTHASDGAGGGGTGRPGAGERLIDVAVTAGADLAAGGTGQRVDVLITTDASSSRGRTYLALEDVELVGMHEAAASDGGAGSGAAAHATALATLRVTLREAVLLTAAQSFAREVRLLLRPPGERPGGARVAVDAGSL